MIRDFIEFCNYINLQKEQGGLFFVLYKSIGERDLEIKEIDDNLNLIFNLKSITIDFFNEDPEKIINEIVLNKEFSIFNLVNTESLINSNKVFAEILESKRELLVKNKIIIFWLTQNEFQRLSEIAPNFVSFGKGSVLEIIDKSILTISDIEEMIKKFEVQYGFESKEFLERFGMGELQDSYEYNFWNFLLKEKEEWKK